MRKLHFVIVRLVINNKLDCFLPIPFYFIIYFFSPSNHSIGCLPTTATILQPFFTCNVRGHSFPSFNILQFTLQRLITDFPLVTLFFFVSPHTNTNSFITQVFIFFPVSYFISITQFSVDIFSLSLNFDVTLLFVLSSI